MLTTAGEACCRNSGAGKAHRLADRLQAKRQLVTRQRSPTTGARSEVGVCFSMVDSGQCRDVVLFGFQNPDLPGLGIEVVTYGQLSHRISHATLNAAHRTDFHQLFLFTSGAGTTTVDFVDHPCETGTVIYVYPGRVVRLPRPTPAHASMDAIMVLFTGAFVPALTQTRSVLSPFGASVWRPPGTEQHALLTAAAELRSEYRRAVENCASFETTVELVRQLLGALTLRIARLPAHDDAELDDAHRDAFRRFHQELEQSFTSTRNAAAMPRASVTRGAA